MHVAYPRTKNATYRHATMWRTPKNITKCSICRRYRLQRDEELINSMEQSPSGEADSPSAGQEIVRLLCIPKVYYRVHKRTPTDPIGEPNESTPQPHILWNGKTQQLCNLVPRLNKYLQTLLMSIHILKSSFGFSLLSDNIHWPQEYNKRACDLFRSS
jgi:hypothetical protein